MDSSSCSVTTLGQRHISRLFSTGLVITKHKTVMVSDFTNHGKIIARLLKSSSQYWSHSALFHSAISPLVSVPILQQLMRNKMPALIFSACQNHPLASFLFRELLSILYNSKAEQWSYRSLQVLPSLCKISEPWKVRSVQGCIINSQSACPIMWLSLGSI